jgi:hypothetical protein
MVSRWEATASVIQARTALCFVIGDRRTRFCLGKIVWPGYYIIIEPAFSDKLILIYFYFAIRR